MSFEHQFARTDLTEELSIALCGENVIGAVLHIFPKGNKDDSLHLEITPTTIDKLHEWTTEFLYHPNLKERLHLDLSMNREKYKIYAENKIYKAFDSLLDDKEYRTRKTYVSISIDYENILILKDISKIRKISLSKLINQILEEKIRAMP